MPTITLSMPDELKKKMDEFEDINWSAVAREAIKSAAEISDVQIIITPSIPFIDSLPRNKSKITFKVETQ